MGGETYTKEAEGAVPPKSLYEEFCVDPLMPFFKVPPQVYKPVTFVEGNHNAIGCIQQLTFGEGYEYEYAKHKFPALGEANFYMKDTTTEGDVLGDKLECIANEAKYKASSSGGSLGKLTTACHTKGDAVLGKDKVQSGFEKMEKLFKVD